MKQKAIFSAIIICIAAALFLAACTKTPDLPGDQTLYNESINQELDNITREKPNESFEPFIYNYTEREESLYEVAEIDLFTIGNFTSDQVSVFGVMLGDSYESVIQRMGVPDVMSMPADESYKNLEYGKKIGIEGLESGLTFHIANNTVQRIIVKPNFNKYLHGNTSIGTDKQTIYTVLDLPDYTSFVANLKALNYVEKGLEVYLRADKLNRFAFIPPEEFKGVEYVTSPEAIGGGVMINSTKPVVKE